MTVSISNGAAIACADATVDLIDLGSTNAAGVVRIYDGTPPADVSTALSGNTLLAELAMSNPAFGGAVDGTPGGVATANAIADDSAADATGTATFFRVLDRDENPIFQGSVTTTAVGTGDMLMNSVAIQINATVQITSMTYTQPES